MQAHDTQAIDLYDDVYADMVFLQEDKAAFKRWSAGWWPGLPPLVP
jgi:hypothetical protein